MADHSLYTVTIFFFFKSLLLILLLLLSFLLYLLLFQLRTIIFYLSCFYFVLVIFHTVVAFLEFFLFSCADKSIFFLNTKTCKQAIKSLPRIPFLSLCFLICCHLRKFVFFLSYQVNSNCFKSQDNSWEVGRRNEKRH